MDFLVELILEILFEAPIDAAMESKRLKTGVKTAIFCVLGGALFVFFAFLSFSAWIRRDVTAGVFMTAITVVFLFCVIVGAIRGHKRKWKNT